MPFRTRRTIKPINMDTSRPVPHEVLMEVLEDAHWAPTHRLTQPWRFHVFIDEARTQLGEGLRDLYNCLTPQEKYREDEQAKLYTTPQLAPVAIAAVAHIEPSNRIAEVEEIAATACAIQNLMLSAHTHGLGSAWSTPTVIHTLEFVAWLGLDETHRALGIIYIGYPLSTKPLPKRPQRHPLKDHVVFHK